MKTKHFFWLQAGFLLLCSSLMAQTNISGTINTYYKVVKIGSQSVDLSTVPNLNRCDKVLLIQMQGASVDPSNTINYGDITAYNDAGNYEFLSVANVAGNTVTFMSPIARTYNTSGIVQLVTVPQYFNVNVNAPLTCSPWNGATGGVLVFEACDVTLSNKIDVSGKGFRGGNINNGTGAYTTSGNTNFVLPSSSPYSGQKGEGIFIMGPSNIKGRGHNANGGGAGNDINGGGAGGSNCGEGGHGGDVQTSASVPPFTFIAAGGIGGQSLSYGSSINKIFLGGGGGSGHENDGVGTSGGNGGAIIIIQARNISGSGNSILSEGNDVPITTIDGQGGGGAGGTILFDLSGSISGCVISAHGGDGGTDSYGGSACHGKGGGGGGGIIWSNVSLTGNSTLVTGGLAGVFTNSMSACFGGSYGATDGFSGCILEDLGIPVAEHCQRQECPKEPGKLTGLAKQKDLQWNVNIYPNPTSGRVVVDGLSNKGNLSVRVTDISGRVIVDKTVSPVNGSFSLELPAEQSAYFIELKDTNNQVIHKKVMIAK